MAYLANLKVACPDIHTTLTSWSKLSNSGKFDAHFFDDEIEELNKFYLAILKMIGFLGLIEISVSLLGLLKNQCIL